MVSDAIELLLSDMYNGYQNNIKIVLEMFGLY